MKEKKNSKEKAKKEKVGMFANPRTAIGIVAVILLAIMLIWAANPYNKEKALDDKAPTSVGTPQVTAKKANIQPTAVINMITVNTSMTPPPTPTPTPEIIISQGEAVSKKDLTVIAVESPDKISTGDTVTVNITVTPIVRIGGIEMAVIFDSNLRAEKIELGDTLSPDFSSSGSIDEGVVSDIIAQPIDINSGFSQEKFTLATITFTAIKQGEATIAIKKFSAVDPDSNLIAVAIVNKQITIG